MTDLAGRPIGRPHHLEPEDGTLRESDARTGFPWVNAWADKRRARRVERAAEAMSGMDYLMSTPRKVVTIYLPLTIIVFVLLFPFYWMFLTAIKPNAQLVDMTRPTIPTGSRIRRSSTSRRSSSRPIISTGCGTR